MPGTPRPSRRKFLQTSALTAGSLAALSPAAYARVEGANERLGLGFIGLGTAGRAHLGALLAARKRLNLEVRSLCDVYRSRAERVATRAGKPATRDLCSLRTGRAGCTVTTDHEEVLGSKAVHAVFVATPDHWHARLALDSIRAGKHVYLEAPAAHTVEQALELARAEQAEAGRVRVQVGVPGVGGELSERVRELIRTNGLGRLVALTATAGQPARAGAWREGEWEDIRDPGKAGLDWARWLGYRFRCSGQELAPRRPWDPSRFFHFRCYWDYARGVASELLYPRLVQLLKATGLGYPERAAASGGIWVFRRTHAIPASQGGGTDDREVPDTVSVLLDYPGGPTVTLLGSVACDPGSSTVLAGQQAILRFNDGASTEAILEPQPGARAGAGRMVLKGAAGSLERHRANFLSACRDPKVELDCPVSLALRADVAIGLAVRAFRERRVCGWDRTANRAVLE
ncbi:MAG: Gfo/Idh/MocA family oxidoreductase [Gemmataceae bacterium]|nr:Gfo/Idh/MocA family oxidoreductase [Gemmataceae bacterium]